MSYYNIIAMQMHEHMRCLYECVCVCVCVCTRMCVKMIFDNA
jgi:hypothetical protein